MKKFMMSCAAVTMMLFAASCGNKGTNSEAAADVAFETFNVEKYGVTIDVPQGMHRTDDPLMDNGALWSLVPADDPVDFAIYAAMDVSVYESSYYDYTDEKIEEEFNSIPTEATSKQLDLEKKEYSYAIEGDIINEYHRVIFKDNLSATAIVSYTEKYADKMGGEVRDHILNSLKFN